MELIAVEQSRLVSLFLTRRLAGQLYMPTASAAFVERYRFAQHPSSIEDLSAEPIRFGHGIFRDAAIGEFNIYSDGVMIASHSPTDLLDAFLADVLDWANVSLGLDRIETHSISRIYESHVCIHSNRDFLKVLRPLEDLAKLVTTGLKKCSKFQADFIPVGFTFAADHTSIAGLKPAPFKLERRPGVEFSRQLFISSAPLPTKDHLVVLQRLETMST